MSWVGYVSRPLPATLGLNIAQITQPFELYVAVSPMLPKSGVVGAANAVTRWVKKEESRLFLRDAPVF